MNRLSDYELCDRLIEIQTEYIYRDDYMVFPTFKMFSNCHFNNCRFYLSGPLPNNERPPPPVLENDQTPPNTGERPPPYSLSIGRGRILGR